MKITLRRAAQICAELQKEINKISLKSDQSFKLVKAAQPEVLLAEAVAEFEKSVNQMESLTCLMFKIRGKIASADVSVKDLLTQEACARAVKTKFESILQLNVNDVTSQDIWTSEYEMWLNRLLTSESDSYSITKTINSSLITPEFRAELTQKLADLRRQCNTISDQLLAINTSQTIEIDPADSTILEALGIV